MGCHRVRVSPKVRVSRGITRELVGAHRSSRDFAEATQLDKVGVPGVSRESRDNMGTRGKLWDRKRAIRGITRKTRQSAEPVHPRGNLRASKRCYTSLNVDYHGIPIPNTHTAVLYILYEVVYTAFLASRYRSIGQGLKKRRVRPCQPSTAVGTRETVDTSDRSDRS